MNTWDFIFHWCEGSTLHTQYLSHNSPNLVQTQFKIWEGDFSFRSGSPSRGRIWAIRPWFDVEPANFLSIVDHQGLCRESGRVNKKLFGCSHLPSFFQRSTSIISKSRRQEGRSAGRAPGELFTHRSMWLCRGSSFWGWHHSRPQLRWPGIKDLRPVIDRSLCWAVLVSTPAGSSSVNMVSSKVRFNGENTC